MQTSNDLAASVRRVLARFEAQGYTVEGGEGEATVSGPGCEGTQQRPAHHVTWSEYDGVRLNGNRVGVGRLSRDLARALAGCAAWLRMR